MKEFTEKQDCLGWLLSNYNDSAEAIFNHKRNWVFKAGIELIGHDIFDAFENKHTDLDSKQQLEQRVVENQGIMNVKIGGDKIKLRVNPSKFVIVKSDEDQNKYTRNLKGVEFDVYDVLKAFDVTCPALQHLIKKALCAGLRGHKDKSQDLKDILDSAKRAIELNDTEVE